jgi:hypothetical protein
MYVQKTLNQLLILHDCNSRIFRSIDLMAMNQQEGGDTGPRFVKFIIRQYKRWGYFISEHVSFCLKLTTYSLWFLGMESYHYLFDYQLARTDPSREDTVSFKSIKLTMALVFSQRNDITGYTPYGARSIEEYEKYQEFFSEKGLGVVVYLFALAKDGGTMLREPYLKEAIDVSSTLNLL